MKLRFTLFLTFLIPFVGVAQQYTTVKREDN